MAPSTTNKLVEGLMNGFDSDAVSSNTGGKLLSYRGIEYTIELQDTTFSS